MNEYLSMGQFSKLAGIPISTLRYWDSMGLFTPAKRDPSSNFRYYTPMQVMTARFVSVMSMFGLPLQTIKELQLERSPEGIARLILNQEKTLDSEMRKLHDCYSMLHTRLEMIHYSMHVQNGFNVINGVRQDNLTPRDDLEIVDTTKIAVLQRDEMAYIMGPRNDFSETGDFYEPFMNFCHKSDELRINLGFPIVGYHDNFDTFMANPGVPDHFVSMDPAGNQSRNAGNYLVGFNYNYYGQLDDLPNRLQAFATEKKLKLIGPAFTIYLQDEICIKDPTRYLAEVSIQVDK